MSASVFISWSGERSRGIAELLDWWLPRVVPGIRTWMSGSDLPKGERWRHSIGKNLEEHHLGIVCVTPENRGAEWLMFEAGALSKTMGRSKVYPLLLDLHPSELEGPLKQFQATVLDEGDLLKLAQDLNEELDGAREREPVVADLFEKFWPDFDEKLDEIAGRPIASTAMPSVVRAFSERGLSDPVHTSSVSFSEGFERHLLYRVACEEATARFWIFGRKNRKLFDKNHHDFFEALPDRIEAGLDFRCLFLDPEAPPEILDGAHQDEGFSAALRESLANAQAVLDGVGLEASKLLRVYDTQRPFACIIVDNAVLSTRIRRDRRGRAKPLTNQFFTVVDAVSIQGREKVDEFEAFWNRSEPVHTTPP